MPRLWLRLELFELGLLPLPSKMAASLSLANVRRVLDALHADASADADADADVDANAEMQDAEMQDADAPAAERDGRREASFSEWCAAAEPVLQWREQELRAFWLLLVRLHRRSPAPPAPAPDVLDAERCVANERVPIARLAVLLFAQAVKPHSWRAKYSRESFNAVWYRENAESLAAAEAPPALLSAARSPTRAAAAMSPRLGAASPPPPASPHTVGLQDRSTSDAYYLEFVREKLEDLLALLFPSVSLGPESDAELSAEDMDLLGFLLGAGGADDRDRRLSDAYLGWQQLAGGPDEPPRRVEKAAVIARFCKTSLTLNEKLYPPVGFTLAGAALSSVPALALNDGFSLDGEAEEPAADALAPTVLSQLTKTTVIKRADEFADAGAGDTDLIVFSCLDSYIYVLGANCTIVTGPSTGILSLDRCENVQLTTICALARISNCLDSRINLFTPCPPILSGENVGVVLGPYNSKLPGLAQQLAACAFPVDRDAAGCWDTFLNLDMEKDEMEDAEAVDKAPIALQDPSAFREICIPVKASATLGPAERPFAIPPAFAASLKAQLETVEGLRQLVRSDEFDLSTKRTMEMVIQLKFKDWLSATGNVRQVLDLVHLERANGEPKDRA